MNLARITIITPSYNQGDYIGDTIESVLNQEYPNLEYIVMDGGSTDNTIDVLKKYDSYLQWQSEVDRGQSHAINKGLAQSTGDVVAFINSDDVYEPGALLKVGAYYANHPEAAWVTGKCRIIDQHGTEMRRFVTHYKNFWLRFRNYQILQILDYISQPATFWRREVIETVGEFDESLRYAMDYDYSLRVGKHYQLHLIDDYLASFRIHPASKAGASASAQFDADLAIARAHVDSRMIRGLHAAHNSMVVAIYRLLMALSSHSRNVADS